MDGRKNNGGARKGAGRPPKAVEESLHKLMRSALPEEEFWDIVASELRNNGRNMGVAMKLYAGYLYGQPTQKVDLKVEEKNLPEWMQEKLDKS